MVAHRTSSSAAVLRLDLALALAPKPVGMAGVSDDAVAISHNCSVAATQSSLGRICGPICVRHLAVESCCELALLVCKHGLVGL